MWVNKRWFESVLETNKFLTTGLAAARQAEVVDQVMVVELRLQKSKDDITIDWLRSRVNALEKERTVLLMKAAGIALPTPEITPVGPRVFDSPKYDMGTDFNDVGDAEAARLGITHDEEGNLAYVS